MSTSKRLMMALLLLLSTGLCSDSANSLPKNTEGSSSKGTVVKVCDWGAEEVCQECSLTFTWVERGVLFFKISKGGEVILGSAPASCSISER